MSWNTIADNIDRTAKILLDLGRASSPAEAADKLRSLVLQVGVGPELGNDPAAQTALLTVVNAGARAFLGGVNVQLHDDPVLHVGWAAGLTASAAVARYGGRTVTHLSGDHPALTIGIGTTAPATARMLHLSWHGWAAAVVEDPGDKLPGPGNELAGVLAGALGVSELFQHQTGSRVAGRRTVGLSLWRPDLDWNEPEAAGPTLKYLPSSLWLLGLGHLGQAYAWTLGLFPYNQPTDVEVGLVDFDVVVEGNRATQLLVAPGAASIGRRKTRIVADALETLLFRTRIVDRAFTEQFRPIPSADPGRNEPLVALAGFDSPNPRRALGQPGFERVVDAGLGNGYEYLDMLVHTLPFAGDPRELFHPTTKPRQALRPAYEAEIARQVAGGREETAARCGMVDIAGVTVGAAFVGAAASTLVLADLLRALHGGTSYSVIGLDLRNPGGERAVSSSSTTLAMPAYTNARSREH